MKLAAPKRGQCSAVQCSPLARSLPFLLLPLPPRAPDPRPSPSLLGVDSGSLPSRYPGANSSLSPSLPPSTCRKGLPLDGHLRDNNPKVFAM